MAKRPAPKPGTQTAFDGTERVVILKGPEAFLRQQYLDTLRHALANATGLDVDLARHDGTSASLADVLDDCRSPGLLPVHKLVLVEEADRFVNESTRPALEKYAAAPDDRATLVLRAETWRPGRLDKAVQAIGKILECNTLTPDEAAPWAIARARDHHGAALDPQAATLLVDAVGTDLIRLDAELGKLATDAQGPAGKPPRIDLDLVRTHVATTKEPDKAWPLQDAILTGGPAEALGFIHLWLGNAPSDRAVPAMWAVLELCRQLSLAARMAQARTPDAAIARSLNIWPQARASALVNAAKRLGQTRAAALYGKACEADASMKRGTHGRRTLEALCVEIASRLSPRADTR